MNPVLIDHKHQWESVMHLDGCHHYHNQYKCECGALLDISGERQFYERGRMTPSVMMADETGTCARCSELMAGKRRKQTRINILAGKTEGMPTIGWVRISRAKLKDISA